MTQWDNFTFAKKSNIVKQLPYVVLETFVFESLDVESHHPSPKTEFLSYVFFHKNTVIIIELKILL